MKCRSLLLSLALGGSLVASAGTSARDTKDADLHQGEPRIFPSRFLEGGILVPPGVFVPFEAEARVLPFMAENRERFAGKKVLEIGCGSGIVSMFAAKLGATKVVATDISRDALNATATNAKRLGVESVVETRLVPQSDLSAYSVIGRDERFDVILSNPPYSLDLDATSNSAVTDRGDLGFSIVRGLGEHLEPGGVALLFYDSLFYHHVMVKFARSEGWEVRNHVPPKLTWVEAEALFNYYLARLVEREKLDASDFSFDARVDEGLTRIRVRPEKNRASAPLLPGKPPKSFPGWIVIDRKTTD